MRCAHLQRVDIAGGCYQGCSQLHGAHRGRPGRDPDVGQTRPQQVSLRPGRHARRDVT